MDLIFQTSGGKAFSIEVGYYNTVLEIKEKVQKYQAIPVSNQTLIFNGNILPDDLNVHDSDILDRSQIHLIVASDSVNEPSKIHLLLKLPPSNLVPVEMDVKDTIRKLKEKIHETEGIPVSRFVIHANGIELHEQKSIQDCGLLDKSEVIVSVRSTSPTATSGSSSNGNGSAKLRVVILYGAETIPVEVSSSDNVGELRNKLLQMKLDLPAEEYYFIYKQNLMDDVRNFRWHQVGQGDTIEIFRRSVSGDS